MLGTSLKPLPASALAVSMSAKLPDSEELILRIRRPPPCRCDSVLPIAQLRTTLTVGTGSTLWVKGSIEYLPGSRGLTDTPLF